MAIALKPYKEINHPETPPRWEKRRLSWSLHTDNLHPRSVVRVERAAWRVFRTWEDACRREGVRLEFPKLSRNQAADLPVKFGAHVDFPFDGEGGTLAYAFLPLPESIDDGIAGDIHIDPAERWTLSAWWARFSGAVHFQTVLLHEIGHAIGLPHDSAFDSVMFPSYAGPRLRLRPADLRALRSVYVA